jgi:hypothetical protein
MLRKEDEYADEINAVICTYAVKSTKIMKKTSGTAHEYLVVKVVGPGDRPIRILRFEEGDPPIAAAVPTTPHPPLTTTTTTTTPLLTIIPPPSHHDNHDTPPNKRSPDKLISTIIVINQLRPPCLGYLNPYNECLGNRCSGPSLVPAKASGARHHRPSNQILGRKQAAIAGSRSSVPFCGNTRSTVLSRKKTQLLLVG